MQNRLQHFFWRACSVLCFVSWNVGVCLSQNQNFTFSYPGPHQIALNSHCKASLYPHLGQPTFTSTIGANIVAFWLDTSQFSILHPFTGVQDITLNWWVTDDAGNVGSFSHAVSLVDVSPPVFQLSSPLLFASLHQVPPPPLQVPVTDNCTPQSALLIDFHQSTPPPLCVPGSFTRTWIATDASGNTTTFLQVIAIQPDLQPPVITQFPENGTAHCGNAATAYTQWLAQQMANFKATDASGIAALLNNAPPSYPSGCPTPLHVVFTAVDSCGLQATTTAVFSVTDNAPPVFTVPPRDTVVLCPPSGNSHLQVLGQFISTRAWSQVTDACTPPQQLQHAMIVNGVTVDSAGVVAAYLASLSDTCNWKWVGTKFHPKIKGFVPVDFLVRDLCGKVTVQRAIFATTDTLPPILTPSQDTTFESCGNNDDSLHLHQWIVNRGFIQATDQCSPVQWLDFQWVTSSGQSGTGNFSQPNTFPQIDFGVCNWSVSVTFHAQDDCDNTASAGSIFALRDREAPVFIGDLPDSITFFCPQPLPQFLPVGVSDNCDPQPALSFQISFVESLCPGKSRWLAMWTATDQCGNTANITRNILLLDTLAPIFLKLPADTVINCGVVLPPPVVGVDVLATDACSPMDKIVWEETSLQHPDVSHCGHYQYLILRKFTAFDSCGNSNLHIQMIRVQDTLPHLFEGFQDTLQACDQLATLPPPTATGRCGQPVSTPLLVSQTVAAGTCPDDYTLTLTWSATDVCGLKSTFSQIVHVRDTAAPQLTAPPVSVAVDCHAIPAAPQLTATDNCDEQVDVSFSEKFWRVSNQNDCAFWANYQIERKWVAVDNCLHRDSVVQLITVMDSTPPVVQCPENIQLPNSANDCFATVALPAPIAMFDDCTSSRSNAVIEKMAPIQSIAGHNPNDSAADTIRIQLSAKHLPASQAVTGTGTLTIQLENADGDAPTEFFNIFDEQNQFFARTPATSGQCGMGSGAWQIPAAKLNAWFADGVIQFTLAPAGTGSAAVNAICPGGRVKFSLSYEYAQQRIPLSLEVQWNQQNRIDFAAWQPTAMPVGHHTVRYFVTDCSGNESSCSMQIQILDVQPPLMSVAPANIVSYSRPHDCFSKVTLPYPTALENCSLSGSYENTTAEQPVQFYLDANAGWVPQDVVLEFSAAVPNTMSPGRLIIRHRGDNAQPGEFFKIMDENNQQLSVTTLGTVAGECSTWHETTVSLSAAQINAMAADRVITIRLVANRDAGNFQHFISPCGMLNAQNQDGVTAVQGRLVYDFAQIGYVIRNNLGQVQQTGQVVGTTTTAEVPAGEFTIEYKIPDKYGNEGTAQIQLHVRDTVPPTARCRATTIFTNPTGNENYQLTAAEIDAGSTDNCTPAAQLTYSLSKTSFTCLDAGNLVSVQMSVTDAAGNTSSCQTMVRVEKAIFQPDFQKGVCEGGSVQLFANPPMPVSGGGVLYTYSWSGPNGFVSQLENPIIPQVFADGNYTVTVTGLTGCTASATVSVRIQTLPNTPQLSAVKNSLCTGEDLVLQTSIFHGAGVVYSWFEGAPGQSNLLGTTVAPTFLVSQPAMGVHHYYVKVTGNGCSSVPSNLAQIEVFGKPTATTTQPAISICEGEMLSLGAVEQGQGIQYQWSGPNGFSSQQQFPPVISAATVADSGLYTLVVYQNGCPSAPAYSKVIVRPKPARPQIQTDAPACVGETVTFVCNQLAAAQYVWVSPFFKEDTTQINAYTLPNVQLNQAGNWQVYVLQNGCKSEKSLPVLVELQTKPKVIAGSNSPICSGSTLQLSAQADQNNLSFEWSGPANFSSFQQNPTWTSVGGEYQVVVQTSFGCADTARVTVVVVPLPQIAQLKFSANWVGGVQGCLSGTDPVVLEANILPAAGNYEYFWTGPNGFTSNDKVAILPNANASMSGTYSLQVKSAAGCESAVKSLVVSLQDRPVLPQLAPVPPRCEGQALTIELTNAQNYVGNNVQYFWTTPTAQATTNVANLTFQSASVANHAGQFVVEVANNGCRSLPSAPLLVVVYPTPAVPSISGNSPVCAGDTLRLSVPVVPGMSYVWSGPNGFSSAVSNPVLTNAGVAAAGQYYVVVAQHGCFSPFSEPYNVEVKKSPEQPVAVHDGGICLDAPNQKLVLSVVPKAGNAGAFYQWFHASTGQPLGAATPATSFQLTDFQGITSGKTGFYVVANLNGCRSVPSAPTYVQFDKIPNQIAFAGNDFLACAGTPFQLNAEKPAIGTGEWSKTGNNALLILNPNDPQSRVKNGEAGQTYHLVWSLSNGYCKYYDSDTVQVRVNAFVPADGGRWIDTCFTDAVLLSAHPSQQGYGEWSQPNDQAIFLGIKIDQPSSATTRVSGFQGTNRYYFIWTMPDLGCGLSRDTVVVRVVGTVAYAGKDRRVCTTDGCEILQGNTLRDFETGRWSSPNPNLTFANLTDPQTSVCHLLPGVNTLIWTTNQGLCGNRSRDTLLLNYEITPQPQHDTVKTAYGHRVSFNVLQNDRLPQVYELSINALPKYGKLQNLGAGAFTYFPDISFSGEDFMTYEVCNPNCPANDCGIGQVFFHVYEPLGCDVPTIITPNNDGVNDFFAVPCLGADVIQDNSVTIYNRWGAEVFHASPYKNNFDGTRNGEELPAGTYFFVVKFNGQEGVKAGFLVIQR